MNAYHAGSRLSGNNADKKSKQRGAARPGRRFHARGHGFRAAPGSAGGVRLLLDNRCRSTLRCSCSSRRHEYGDGESATGDGRKRERERESVLNEYLPSRSVSEWWVRNAWYNHLFCLPFAPPPARRLHQSRLSMTSHLALRFYTRLVSLSYYYFDSQKNGCVCLTIFRFLLYLVSVVFIAVGISVWFDKWFYYHAFSPVFLSLRPGTIRQGTLNKGIQRTRFSSTHFSAHIIYFVHTPGMAFESNEMLFRPSQNLSARRLRVHSAFPSHVIPRKAGLSSLGLLPSWPWFWSNRNRRYE